MEQELRDILTDIQNNQRKTNLALYGDHDNKQLGLIDKVEEHSKLLEDWKSIKEKGKFLWKLVVGGLAIIGYLFGKGIEHGITQIETFFHH